MMSWIDGFELCRGLRTNPYFGQIPICMLSACCRPADLEKGRRYGVTAYFCKPIDPLHFVHRIDEIIAASSRVMNSPSAARMANEEQSHHA